MFLSGQVNFLSQLVLGQVDFCNISTALLYVQLKDECMLYGYIILFQKEQFDHCLQCLLFCLLFSCTTIFFNFWGDLASHDNPRVNKPCYVPALYSSQSGFRGRGFLKPSLGLNYLIYFHREF